MAEPSQHGNPLRKKWWHSIHRDGHLAVSKYLADHHSKQSTLVERDVSNTQGVSNWDAEAKEPCTCTSTTQRLKPRNWPCSPSYHLPMSPPRFQSVALGRSQPPNESDRDSWHRLPHQLWGAHEHGWTLNFRNGCGLSIGHFSLFDWVRLRVHYGSLRLMLFNRAWEAGWIPHYSAW